MHNWSLVCFTLMTQSAIGLVWVGALASWFGADGSGEVSRISMISAFVLTALGLIMALAHLAKPQKAPHAIRNLAVSWLSREVALVPVFAGAVALLILLPIFNITSGLVWIEAGAGLLGGAVLLAMTRVYLLKTVPMWNSSATALEFAGSALVLGGAVKWSLASFSTAAGPGFSTEMTVAAIAIGIGVLMKAAAIRPALAARRTARARSWYKPGTASASSRRIIAARQVLNIVGLLLIVSSWSGPAPLWPILCLACFATGEVIGRNQFYHSYQRIGL